MFIHEKFVFLALSKTGCTYTQRVLDRLLTGIRTDGRHLRMNEAVNIYKIDVSNRLKVGNVRNPWDWYVSLWGYGCMGKGSLYRHLLQQHPDKPIQSFYADVNDPELFQQWLKVLLLDDSIKTTIGDSGSQLPILKTAGLYSYRYLKQYSCVSRRKIATLTSPAQIKAFDASENVVDLFIKTEDIDQGIAWLLNWLEVTPETLEKYQRIRETVNKNNSDRTNYQFYYDDFSRDLVGDREQLIIEKHNYRF